MQQREHLSDDEVLPETVGTEERREDDLLTAERDVQLWSAFRQLPPQCQRLLRILATDPPPSYAEVSAALGTPIGSIGPTRARCLERLRRQLALVGVVTGSEPREQALLASVHERVEKGAPVPPPVVEEAQQNYSWRPVDLDVGELVFDSAVESSGLTSQASSTTRSLRYRAADHEVILEVRPVGQERELSGRIEPPQAARVEIRSEDSTLELHADPKGRFLARRILGGRTSLRLTLQDGTELATGWVVL